MNTMVLFHLELLKTHGQASEVWSKHTYVIMKCLIHPLTYINSLATAIYTFKKEKKKRFASV